VTTILITERSTLIRRLAGVLVGQVRPAPQVSGSLTPELRPFLATYRESLNSNSSLYQALSFYKVLEGVATWSKTRGRAAMRAGGAPHPDPLLQQIPSDPTNLPDMTVWAKDLFTPYLGKTFADVKASVDNTIRNAIAHLTPGRDIRDPDKLKDLRSCRDIVPVLRYIAHELIQAELT
jgi:hypothetical protein